MLLKMNDCVQNDNIIQPVIGINSFIGALSYVIIINNNNY